jgi:hypothetical protein
MPVWVIYADTEELLKSGRGELALSSTQAAARLGFAERRIRELVKGGELTPIPEKNGVSHLYLERDVMDLYERRKKMHF